MGKRLVYLDVAKALAMFLVLFGHIIVEYDSRGYGAPFALGIYSFHTALFMFLSGFFFQSCLRKGFKSLLKEKTIQLLIPYICWWTLYLFIIDIPESHFDVVGCIKSFMTGGILKGFWYVKLLFVYIVVTWILVKVFRNKWLGCTASFALFTLLPNFSFSRMFIPFFLAGYLGRELLDRMNHYGWIVACIFIDIILFLFWKGEYNYISLDMRFVPYIVRTGIGIMTSVLILLSLKRILTHISEDNKVVRSIAYTGSITLGIYLCHNFFFRSVLWGWIMEPLPHDNILVYFVYAVIVYIIVSAFVTLLGKNKYLSFLFLGKIK